MLGNSFSNNGNSAYGFAGPMPEPVPSVAPLPVVAVLRARCRTAPRGRGDQLHHRVELPHARRPERGRLVRGRIRGLRQRHRGGLDPRPPPWAPVPLIVNGPRHYPPARAVHLGRQAPAPPRAHQKQPARLPADAT